MRRVVIFIGILFSLSSCSRNSQEDLTVYVNPLIGTDFVGNTYPGVQVPFGMVQLSPDNGLPGWDRIAGYFYPDSTIAGFSHTHLQGTGAGDLYDISFLPVTLPYREAEAPLGIHSKFLHSNETAQAGYYQVFLTDYDINVELTSTERVGIQRYTFPESNSAVLLNLSKAMNWDFTKDSEIKVIDSVTVCGYRFSEGWAKDQRLYFVTKFSRPFDQFEIDTMSIFQGEEHKYTGKGSDAIFYFSTQKDEQIVLKTSLSCVSVDGAKLNLEVEAPHWDFDEYRNLSKEKWNAELSKIKIKGKNVNDKVNFYTALYRSFSAPTLYCDVDGQYLGVDKRIHQSVDWQNYSTFSLWDTYRAAHPLYALIQTERTNDMIKSFLAHYEEFGRLPVWNFQGNETDMMIGYHSVPVIADAVLKGIGDFDRDFALKACVETANKDDYRGIGLYKKYGYIPYDKEGESLSKTLEYAFDDWCIAQMAKYLNRDSLFEVFSARADNYKNLYNSKNGFFQPRHSDGSFIPHFEAKEYTSHITESNAWHYLWSVQHDVDGLKTLMGKELFALKMDSMFSLNVAESDELPIFSTGMIGQYAHGNEPSHHVIYLFNVANKPYKTQYYVAKVMNELYRNAPDGLCGNEDCGQMSAWYVWSALGFYPVNPASGMYEIGTPLFDEVEICYENGKNLRLKAKNLSKKNIYIKEVRVDGKVHDNTYFTHQQLLNSSLIEFEMSDCF
ncbi:MAG: GH92 family glycosyl hydrolase [Paludibacteraceae bacterium]|nr:GH92 family glycosyl hydrolase [Paludibacteraceae bacterium]